MSDTERPVLHDADGRGWVSVASSKDVDALRDAEVALAHMLWGGMSHAELTTRLCEDLRTVPCYDSALQVSLDRWSVMTAEERQRAEAFVHGYLEGRS